MKDVIDPAVNSTLNLLNSAHKHVGPQLKTFIYMSSLVTLFSPIDAPNHHYASESWNLTAEHAALKLSGDEEAPFSVLSGLKNTVRTAMFNFRGSMKPSFAIVSVIPGVVIGRQVLFPEKVEDIKGR
jgi:hypothetical protein